MSPDEIKSKAAALAELKPEPRRMWEVVNPKGGAPVCTLHDEAMAQEWRAKGSIVTEWVEVLP